MNIKTIRLLALLAPTTIKRMIQTETEVQRSLNQLEMILGCGNRDTLLKAAQEKAKSEQISLITALNEFASIAMWKPHKD